MSSQGDFWVLWCRVDIVERDSIWKCARGLINYFLTGPFPELQSHASNWPSNIVWTVLSLGFWTLVSEELPFQPSRASEQTTGAGASRVTYIVRAYPVSSCEAVMRTTFWDDHYITCPTPNWWYISVFWYGDPKAVLLCVYGGHTILHFMIRS